MRDFMKYINSVNEVINFGGDNILINENDFRDYVNKFIFSKEKTNYYSLLRPLLEIQIVKLFSNYNLIER